MIERFCHKVVDITGRTNALATVMALSVAWLVFGALSRIDPYPFQFLSTVCNLLGFWMLFILAVGQRTDELHDRFDMLHSHLEDLHDRLNPQE